MKTLWIVNHHATTLEGSTGGARHALLGAQLQEHGWETVVFAASSEHYSGRQRVSGWRLRADELAQGVRFRWIRVRPYSRNGLGRIINMLSFSTLLLMPRMTSGLPKPDKVIGSSVHPLAAWAALILARRHGVPFYFEIRDLWPETLIQMGALSRDGKASRALRALEKHLCSNAEKVITTMPHARDYLVLRGIPADKILWISNGVEFERFAGSPQVTGAGLDFLYFGAFGNANALHVLLEGFAQAREGGLPASARLRLVGQGPERENLQALVVNVGLGDVVSIEDPVPRADIPELAASADVLVVALLPLKLYEYGISLNKLFEYMASGRPILFAGRARGNPVDGRGGVVTDCDAAGVAAGMLEIAAMSPEERAAVGSHNRDLAHEKFSFEALAARLSAALNGSSTVSSP